MKRLTVLITAAALAVPAAAASTASAGCPPVDLPTRMADKAGKTKDMARAKLTRGVAARPVAR